MVDRTLRVLAAASESNAALASLVSGGVRNRDQQAAYRLVEALYPQVIRIVRNHLPRGADAADLAQDVFVQFFRTLDRYDPARPLENWVSRLAVNVCLNELRRRRRPEVRWTDLSDGERTAVAALLAESPPAEPLRAETRELLDTLLASLSAEDRLVITMLHLEERPGEEIARLTGWSRVVVRMRAYRARRRLRRQLWQLDGERR